MSKTDNGFVYLALAPILNRVKIGLSTSPNLRLASMTTGSPEPLELFARIACENMKEEEDRLHREFQECRLHGEWFSVSGPVKIYMEKIKESARKGDCPPRAKDAAVDIRLLLRSLRRQKREKTMMESTPVVAPAAQTAPKHGQIKFDDLFAAWKAREPTSRFAKIEHRDVHVVSDRLRRGFGWCSDLWIETEFETRRLALSVNRGAEAWSDRRYQETFSVFSPSLSNDGLALAVLAIAFRNTVSTWETKPWAKDMYEFATPSLYTALTKIQKESFYKNKGLILPDYSIDYGAEPRNAEDLADILGKQLEAMTAGRVMVDITTDHGCRHCEESKPKLEVQCPDCLHRVHQECLPLCDQKE